MDEDDIIDSKSKLIQVDIVIDRIVLREDQRSRIADSLELTFSEGAQQAIVLVDNGKSSWKEVKLSMELSCEICGQIFPTPSAKMFSWNHPDGACESCGGTEKHYSSVLNYVFLMDLNLQKMVLSNHGD